MKREGLVFTILVVAGGVLRLASPGTSASSPESQTSTPKEAQTKVRANPGEKYLEQLRGTIKESYPSADSTPQDGPDLNQQSDVPQPVREHVRFVVAILPDPVHTHLAMFFDRSVEALQLAAQRIGYTFDHSILPWDRTAHPESTDFKLREQEAEERDQRETYPGVLIFRAEPDWQHVQTHQSGENKEGALAGHGDESRQAAAKSGATPEGPLFVFVVGETPTGGIHRVQLRNALELIREIRGKDTTKDETLFILGPTFSGSLESLGRELEHQPAPNRAERVFVYSGTITNVEAEDQFTQQWPTVHLASFQENDAYALHEFLGFTSILHYEPHEIAVLSEDETIYGNGPSGANDPQSADASAGDKESSQSAKGEPDAKQSAGRAGENKVSDKEPEEVEVIRLHFPREISYLRTAYQKATQTQPQAAAKPQGQSILPLDLNDGGTDDDTVSPYAPLQTPLSQEAVMMGIVSELHKHQIKFTLLLATDPLDELFLARYLRQAYPQGRVVITVPDLLLSRQDDALLHGVMGLNNYPLIPGLRDRLLPTGSALDVHEDRVFVSSNSVGTFNAMVGLLSVKAMDGKDETLPDAPYAEYGAPMVEDELHHLPRKTKPILWLTMLGRDGYWPIVGIKRPDDTPIDRQETILEVLETGKLHSTMKEANAGSPPDTSSEFRPPTAWKVAYFLVVLLLAGHGVLSAFGSILADSEAQAQFARNTADVRGATIVALGAFALSTSFVLIMCTRNPFVTTQHGFPWLTTFLWLPYPVFVGLTIVDLGKWRKQPTVAASFAVSICVMMGAHVLLILSPWQDLRMYWSTRVLHLASGLSPVLPMLMLLAAGYWWMWISLKGIALVDLRRPRLPEKQDLPLESYRISDTEGEQLRNVSHPFYFTWQVMIPTVVLAVGFLAVLDLGHPLQTVEGKPYDWGYSLLLALMVATFLGCLLKLVITWFKCRQILMGLDRTPLRHAFSRMKNLSWSSLWTPGGSTLRETYRIMSRALENLGRLQRVLEEDSAAPIPPEALTAARAQIRTTLLTRQEVYELYATIMRSGNPTAKAESGAVSDSRGPETLRVQSESVLARIKAFLRECKERWAQPQKRADELQGLMEKVGALQKEMARTAAVLIRQVLRAWWVEQTGPVVSEDERIEKEELPPIQALAEEFAAIMYVNFLASVLLRIRTLVVCAGGLYVLIVLSVSAYPFEPHSALQTMMVLLLIVMAAVVGYVYAEMHREAILSRLTSTKAGELGWDFWLKFGSAAAIPVRASLPRSFRRSTRSCFPGWSQPYKP
jgi:hypothetical protein